VTLRGSTGKPLGVRRIDFDSVPSASVTAINSLQSPVLRPR
jgi:hypothetical protein